MLGHIFNYRNFIEDLLGNDKAYKFALWAFGEEFESETKDKLPDRWNELHGKDFMLTYDGHVETDLLKMIELWEHKE